MRRRLPEGIEARLAVEEGAERADGDLLLLEVGDVLRLSLHKGDFTMNGCGLERFPSVLSNTLTLQMGTLRQLRLSRNKLSSLPPSAPKYLRGLVELDLRSNRLTTLPDSIRLMTGLRLLRRSARGRTPSRSSDGSIARTSIRK